MIVIAKLCQCYCIEISASCVCYISQEKLMLPVKPLYGPKAVEKLDFVVALLCDPKKGFLYPITKMKK